MPVSEKPRKKYQPADQAGHGLAVNEPVDISKRIVRPAAIRASLGLATAEDHDACLGILLIVSQLLDESKAAHTCALMNAAIEQIAECEGNLNAIKDKESFNLAVANAEHIAQAAQEEQWIRAVQAAMALNSKETPHAENS